MAMFDGPVKRITCLFIVEPNLPLPTSHDPIVVSNCKWDTKIAFATLIVAVICDCFET